MTGGTPAHRANQYTRDPRQRAFLNAYYSPTSDTYSNAYQSALRSGYSEATAKDLLHNRPKWLSETPGDSQAPTANQLLEALGEIINNSATVTRDKIKAIELLMKHHGMLKERVQVDRTMINIQSVLD
ncbi:hypothetical protein JNJ66_06130 [Candidatus Saccharibacteria bacterium]|nr:hypothetical protein [Candidatus Saccharibacteria bacterium]